jgi:DNA modification methylase
MAQENIIQFEFRKVDDLLPYARNARTHNDAQVAQLAASIVEWGWTNPILADETGIVAGHGRLAAARLLYGQGKTIRLPSGSDVPAGSVPVLDVTGWSPSQRRAYVLADNQLALNAGWDDDMLKEELKALLEDGFDLNLVGMDDADVRLAPEPTDVDADPQLDKFEELRAQWGTELGQVWQVGRHRLACGDSTDALVVASLLGNERPHLMVTDPPYGVEYDAEWRQAAGIGGAGAAVGKVMNDDRADWRDAWALFPGDVAYVWHAMKTQHSVACSLIESALEIRAEIVWAKSAFVISQGLYHSQHESCFYAVRKGGNGHWAGDRKQSTLWTIPKPRKSETGHSTQKPVECMERPIRNNSLPGDLVYEPFCGSGTTIIACERSGRTCRAIELNPAYVAVALQRFKEATGVEPVLLGGSDGVDT